MTGSVLGEHDATVLVAIIGLLGLFIQNHFIKRDTRQINRAVNHVSDGESPMIDRVRDLEDHQQWQAQVLHLLALQLGVALPPPPPRRSKP